MPRQPRYNLTGLPQHIIQRGNNRQAVFFDRRDYQKYLRDLNEIALATGCDIHAFVLMTNHVHLLATPTVPNGISKLMQGLGRRYVAYVNRKYQRSGTLWEGRYKASLVAEDSYLLACMRYIELNPVRAGMVEHPGEYRWASYSFNAHGKGCGINLKEHHSYKALVGVGDDQRVRYRELFNSALGVEMMYDIRQSLNSCLVLGNERFKDEIEAQLKRKVRLGKAGRPSKKSCHSAMKQKLEV
jgi:putative transposase